MYIFYTYSSGVVQVNSEAVKPTLKFTMDLLDLYKDVQKTLNN